MIISLDKVTLFSVMFAFGSVINAIVALNRVF